MLATAFCWSSLVSAAEPPAPRFSYSRLFTGPAEHHDEKALTDLAILLKDIPENRGRRDRGGKLPPSVYVYFGQLIDHDLTRDETKLVDAAMSESARTNVRTPVLDLDSVYGHGPDQNPELYEPDKMHLRCGKTQAGALDDLPCDANGVQVLGDDRDDENLILSQLHVAFLQFHNRILDRFIGRKIPDPEKYGTTAFERARRFVTWDYQYIVYKDFLQRMILGSVWNMKEEPAWRLFKHQPGDTVALPVEFTQAGFRFGHSLVQAQYSLQANGRKPLLALIRKAPPGTPRPALARDEVIDWTTFVGCGATNFAENFDTLIAAPMYELPQTAFAIFWGRSFVKVDVPLPAITLLRGSRMGFVSGQEACNEYKIKPIANEKLGFRPAMQAFLKQNGMAEPHTPLWFYELREAEVEGLGSDAGEPCSVVGANKSHPPGGECLGPLGSRIALDVLLGVLEADKAGYFVNEPGWTPPPMQCSNQEECQLKSIEDLVLFAKGMRCK